MSAVPESISIRPQSSVFATYRRLSYKPWYAVAEFVDNSTQSFFDNEAPLAEAGTTKLTVNVVHDRADRTLVITDNAYGMSFQDFQRAVQLNKPPIGEKTRNEFGMGLKTAACWMGERWSVRTKALGSDTEYMATVDVPLLAEKELDELPVNVRRGLDPSDHYTVVRVEGMYRVFQTRTTGRIKELLGSMYRRDIASGKVDIYWNDERLEWDEEPIFAEALPDGSVLDWRTKIDVEVQDGLRATGWAGIRLPGSSRRAGLHLFRRDRIIVGGPHQGWKPRDLFGAPNSFASQRIVGELNLDEWPVTQAKDGFDWDGGLEDALVEALGPDLRPLIDKASGRIGSQGESEGPSAGDASVALDALASAVRGEEVGASVSIVEVQPPADQEGGDLVALAEAQGLEPTLTEIGRTGIPDVKWYLLDEEHPKEEFYRCDFVDEKTLHIFLNLRHPFVQDNVGSDSSKLTLYMMLILGDALVERAQIRRGEPVTPHGLRMMKDTFLRSLPPRS